MASTNQLSRKGVSRRGAMIGLDLLKTAVHCGSVEGSVMAFRHCQYSKGKLWRSP